MRILTTAGFTLTLMSISGFTALANPIHESSSRQSKTIAESIVAQVTPDSSGVVGDTYGEDVDALRERLLIDPLTVVKTRTSGPGSVFGTPSAYGASWGNAFAGASYITAGDTFKDDGSFSLGMGFGNPLNSVGLEVALGIISVDGFAQDGTLGFKLHKAFKNNFAVALGWSNSIQWGDAERAKDTVYGVATKRLNLQPNNNDNKLPLTVSLGLGTGSYRSQGAVEADENPLNLFAGAGLRVTPALSLISSWTGRSLNLGVSVAPFRNVPIVINTGMVDVTDNTGDGTRFLFTTGYAYRL